MKSRASIAGTIVYLSPHLDDVALSCGGHVYQQSLQGGSALIVTIMAGDPPAGETSRFAQSLHQRWELPADVITARRREDVEACDRLGAGYIHLDIPDCIYRRHPVTKEPLYPSEESLFGPLHPAESGLVKILTERLANLLQGRRFLVPLGVGNHVDHQLTRQVAERWLRPEEMIYYEEFPYARDKGALEVALGSDKGWRSEILPLEETSLMAKIEAVTCYHSQLSTFFYDNNDLEQQIRSYCEQVGGERYWSFAGRPPSKARSCKGQLL